jgi:hypothetical protein
MFKSVPPPPVLTFELLDDLLFGPEEEIEKKLLEANIFRIGPLVEYALLLNPDASTSFLRKKRTSESTALSSVLNAGRKRVENPSLKPLGLEFFKTPEQEADFSNPLWIAFRMRLQVASERAGFPKTFARELAGTFGEMVSNLAEHSEHSETGVVGYRWGKNEFEYVVADQGIGVLKSLRQHRDFKDKVTDYDQALTTALTQGASRYGLDAKRGKGFDTLVLNIANRNSCLRFRSGDRSHVIDGRTSPPTRTTYTCAPYQGFLISVLCLNNSRS